MDLPHGAVGWSAVCDCGVPDHTHLLFCHFIIRKQQSQHFFAPGRVAQSVMCLATDASLTADPGVASWIPARSHTNVLIMK